MTENDQEKFKEGLCGIYAFYDKELSDFALEVWWNALKNYDLKAIVSAFGRHMINTEAGRWLPKPADIVRMLAGSSQDAALVAWAKVDQGVRRVGTYVDVVFDDPLIHRVLHDMGGWIAMGYKTEDEWPFVAKEFENRYRGFRERSDIPDYPQKLIGIANAHNESQGLPLQPYVMIGDEKTCNQVLAGGSNKSIVSFTQSENALIHLISDAKKARNGQKSIRKS